MITTGGGTDERDGRAAGAAAARRRLQLSEYPLVPPPTAEFWRTTARELSRVLVRLALAR